MKCWSINAFWPRYSYDAIVLFRVGESASFENEANLVNKAHGISNNCMEQNEEDGLVNGKAEDQHIYDNMQAMSIEADGATVDILGKSIAYIFKK